MPDMLTSKEMQDLLQVDRSTIYRMAEDGRLPAIKVGKQWRFPSESVANWLKVQAEGGGLAARPEIEPVGSDDVASLLPLECVQLIQDAFAEILGVTLIVTDLEGRAITTASNPSPLFHLLEESGKCYAIWRETWRQAGQVPALEPRFTRGPGGLQCARALVRIGNELQVMVVTFGLAAEGWKPDTQAVEELAQVLEISQDEVQTALNSVVVLDRAEQKTVLVAVQRIADVLAHVGDERMKLLNRLASIADLSAVH